MPTEPAMPPPKLIELISRFDEQRETYRSGQYNETQVRREFIDPLFALLGWDIDNKQGNAEQYKDVIHEDAIRVGGLAKAPDYCFRIGGTRKFFVEAKKPAVNVREDISAAYQIRRYAWSAKLPLSILTDFEEFAVYDCRKRPEKGDSSATGRILYMTCAEYAKRWDEIASRFSKDAILKGAFDKFAESAKGKRGTTEVDAAFLAEIESWRDALARHLALRNPALTQRELNFAVQRTIDRIIFLRICEDRGIEPYGQLQALQNGANTYPRICAIFDNADDRYNSGLFHFHAEKNRLEPPDELSKKLTIDDKVLKDILKRLYYPDSPYEFSVLPADILGQVYEQFLGKVIRLTAGHQAKVEEKPEVKKAGGVYYTPTYIVDYIVRHTVGKLLEGKTPKNAAELRILDPACGSGSFLIGAYQHLLDWHLQYYLQDGPEKQAKGRHPALVRTEAGWKLTTGERKRILLNNIYGVDIDSQAVEVTKLSLLLKVLEGETEESLNTQISMFRERALPDLGSNIKCGNSLIGPDFYEGQQQLAILDEEEMYRINVFDWNSSTDGFGKIMNAGGFDAVIGNPPYVFGRDWKYLGISAETKTYLGRTYTSSPYQLDMFSIFMEKAANLSKMGGYIGQIVPNVWLSNTYSSTTRAHVLSQANDLLISVPATSVFPGLTVDTVVYTLQKSTKPAEHFAVTTISNIADIAHSLFPVIDYIDGARPISTTVDEASSKVLAKLRLHSNLHNLAHVTRGVHAYRTGGYGRSAFVNGPQIERDLKERPYHSLSPIPGYTPFVYGKDLRRFAPPIAHEFIKYGPWLAEPRSPDCFEGCRIYSRKILGDRLVISVEKGISIADQQVYITRPFEETDTLYIAGLLGSTLMAFYIRHYFDEVNDAFPQIKVGQLKSLPIRTIDISDPTDVARHDRMVSMVQQMLDLNKRLAAANTDQEKNVLKRQIEATDRQIDLLVYELYGLTDEEIALVEKAG